MAQIFRRHRWAYPAGVSAYEARTKTCKRCGTTAKTFGVGAGRIWDYRTPDGQHTRAGVCIPLEEK